MEIKVERTEGALVAMTEGRVDGANAREFHEALQNIIDDNDRTVILDMGGLTYISSAGLRAILQTARTLKKQNGRLAVCALTDSVNEVFRISGFDKIIETFPSSTEAIGAG